MKKWILGVVVLLVAVAGSFYLFIPASVGFHNSLRIAANPQGFTRIISNENNWHTWWPGEQSTSPAKKGLACFESEGITYLLTEKRYNAFVFLVSGKDIHVTASLNFVRITNDSVQVFWNGQSNTTANVFRRLPSYRELKAVNQNMNKILQAMQTFFSNEENIYGRHIAQTMVTDSLLVSNYSTSKGYPSTAFIYGLLNQLKAYAASQSAKETGYPMLHVTTSDSINFLTRVALPVERRLPNSGNISFKWMLPGGNILVTEVKGGPASINKAFQELQNYLDDHQRMSPAIPFQSIITDRMQEKDTGKWVTRLYYPVV